MVLLSYCVYMVTIMATSEIVYFVEFFFKIAREICDVSVIFDGTCVLHFVVHACTIYGKELWFFRSQPLAKLIFVLFDTVYRSRIEYQVVRLP